jgi:uncharacterized protein YecT (DUF1311 family)
VSPGWRAAVAAVLACAVSGSAAASTFQPVGRAAPQVQPAAPSPPKTISPVTNAKSLVSGAPAVKAPLPANLKLPTPSDPVLAHYSPIYESCMRKAVSTLDIIDCVGRENERWDVRLGRVYQSRLASFNDRQRGALKRAQKAWVLFREADCAAYEDDDWGTISRIDASQCMLRRTVERALELEALPTDHGPG